MTGPVPQVPANPSAPEVLVPTPIPAAAGMSVTVPVRVRHRGHLPASMRITVLGLDSRWAPEPLDLGPLQPGEAAEVTLTLVPERGAMGARYPFAVAVEATAVQGAGEPVIGIAESVLVVDSQERITMSIQPPAPSAVFGRTIRVQITNPGSRDRELTLVPEAARGASVHLQHEQVRVPAQHTVSVKGKVRIRRPSLMGPDNSHTFTVTAQGTGAPEFVEASVRARPMFRRAPMAAIGVLLVVALWVSMAIVFIPKISDAFKPKSVVGAPQTVTSQGPVASSGAAAGQSGSGNGGSGGSGSGGSGAGGNGGSGGGSGSGGSGGGGSDNGSAQSAGYQLSGTVTGPGSKGVTVTLAPTSLVGASEVDAKQAPGASEQTANALRSVTASVGKVPAEALAVAGTARRSNSGSTSIVTGKSGEFSFAGISAPGYYLLTLQKPGFQTQRFLINSADLASPQPMKINLAPGNGRLSGTVVDTNGSAIGAATITITDGTVSLQTSSVSRSAQGTPGTFTADNLSTPGDYLVTATAPGYGGSSSLVHIGPKGHATADLTLKSGQASITGAVTGEDGLGTFGGLGGISVTATNGKLTRSATTVTSRALRGTFILPNMPTPGTYTVTISGDGFLTQTRTVTLAAGAGSATVNASLDRADGTVSGVVTGLDAHGKSQGGLVGVGLSLTSSTTTLKTMTTSGGTAGGYRFTGVPPGTYVLTASQYGRVPASATVEIKAADSKSVDLDLRADSAAELPATSHIRGQVVDSRTGGPLTCDRTAAPIEAKDCVVTVTVKAPVDPADSSKGTVSYTATSTAALDFVYTVPRLDDPQHPGLPPGLYTVTVSAPGYETSTTHVQVAQGQTAPAPQVSLPVLGIISGTVTTRVGTPTEPTCVIAVPSGKTIPSPAPTDCRPDKSATACSVTGIGTLPCGLTSMGGAGQAAAGSYQIRGLTHGQYQILVMAQDPEYRYSSENPPTVSLDLGSDGQFNAILDRLGRIELTVLAADQQTAALSPVAKAAVRVTPAPAIPLAGMVTDSRGDATITGLQGNYTVSASAPLGTGHSSSIAVGLNQTVPVTVVLSQSIGAVVGQVTTTGVDGSAVPVPGATVTLTGTVLFSGTTSVVGTATVTTDDHGCYAIVPKNWPSTGAPPLTSGPCSNAVGPASTTTMLDPDGEPATLINSRVTVGVADTPVAQAHVPSTEIITGSGMVRSVPAVLLAPKPVSFGSQTLHIRWPSDLGERDLSATPVTLAVTAKPSLAGGVTVGSGVAVPVTTGAAWGLDVPLTIVDQSLPGPGVVIPGRYTISASLSGFVTATVQLFCDLGTECRFVAGDSDATTSYVMNELPRISGTISAPNLPGGSAPDWSTATVSELSGPANVGTIAVVATGDANSGTVVFGSAGEATARVVGGKYTFQISMPGYFDTKVTVVCGDDFTATPSGGSATADPRYGCTPLTPGTQLKQLATFDGSITLKTPDGVPAFGTPSIAVTQQPNPSVTITAAIDTGPDDNPIEAPGPWDISWSDSSLPASLVAIGDYTLQVSAPGYQTRSFSFSCNPSDITCGPHDVTIYMLPQITGTILVPTPLPVGITSSTLAQKTTVTLQSGPSGTNAATVTLGTPTPAVDQDGNDVLAMTVNYADPQYASIDGGPANLASRGSYTFLVTLSGYGQTPVPVQCAASYTTKVSTGALGCDSLSTELTALPRFSGAVALNQTLAGDLDTFSGTMVSNSQPGVKVTVDASGKMTWIDPSLPIDVVSPGTYTLQVSKDGYASSKTYTIDVDPVTSLCSVDGGTPSATCALGTVTLDMYPAGGGTVTADYLPPGATTLDVSQAAVTVLEAPTGASRLVVRLQGDPDDAKSADLVWNDPSLPLAGITRPGTYKLKISVPGYQAQQTAEFTCSSGGTCTPADAVQIDRHPEFTGTLTTVPVTDSSSASFQVTGGPLGVGSVSLTSTADGTLTWHEQGQPSGLVTPGTYSISATLTGYLGKTGVSFTCTSTSGSDGPTCGSSGVVTLKAPTSVTIQLVTENPADADDPLPVTGAKISFAGNTVLLSSVSNSYTTAQALDPDGTYTAVIHAPGYRFVSVDASSTDTVSCTNGTTRSGLALAPGGSTVCTVTLSPLGTIVAQTNSSVPSAGGSNTRAQLGSVDVTATYLCSLDDTSCPSKPAKGADSFSGTSSGTGSLTLTGTYDTEGLTDGVWQITASQDGYRTRTGTVLITSDYAMAQASGSDALTVSGDGVLQIDLTPNQVTLHLELQSTTSSGTTDILPRGSVQISGPSGATCTINASGKGTLSGPGGGTCTGTDPDDSSIVYVIFGPIYPGTYTAKIVPYDTSLAQVQATVVVGLGASGTASDNVQTAQISMTAVASNATGSVEDESTTPATKLVGATVLLSSSNTDIKPAPGYSGGLLSTTTKADGSFQITAIPDGSYYLVVTKTAGYADYVSPQAITFDSRSDPNQTIPAVDIEASRNHVNLSLTLGSTATTPTGGTAPDFTGATVYLLYRSTPGGAPPPASPPSSTSISLADDGSYVASFNSVPTGDWVAALTYADSTDLWLLSSSSGSSTYYSQSDQFSLADPTGDTPAPTQDATAIFPEGATTLTVTWPVNSCTTGAPEGTSISLTIERTESGNSVGSSTFSAPVTTADGLATASTTVYLPPGSYQWSMPSAPSQSEGWTSTVSDDGEFSIDEPSTLTASSVDPVSESDDLTPATAPINITATIDGSQTGSYKVTATTPGDTGTSPNTTLAGGAGHLCVAIGQDWTVSMDSSDTSDNPYIALGSKTVNDLPRTGGSADFVGYTLKPSVKLPDVPDLPSPSATVDVEVDRHPSGGGSLITVWSQDDLSVTSDGWPGTGNTVLLIVPAGAYSITATPGSGDTDYGPNTSGTVTVSKTESGPADVSTTLKYAKASATITVLKPDTSGAEGAALTLTAADSTQQSCSTTQQTGTDSDGDIICTELTPGATYGVNAHWSDTSGGTTVDYVGYGTLTVGAAGDTGASVTVTLVKGPAALVTIKDGDAAASGARLLVYDQNGDPVHSDQTFTTDALGTALIGDLSAGTYYVVANLGTPTVTKTTAPIQIVVTSGTATASGSLVGAVSLPVAVVDDSHPAKELAGATVSVTASGVPLGPCSSSADQCMTAADTNPVSITGLPRGTAVYVTATLSGYDPPADPQKVTLKATNSAITIIMTAQNP